MKLSLLRNVVSGASILLIAAGSFFGCAKNGGGAKAMEDKLSNFIKKYEATVKPIYRDQADAYFKASIDGQKASWDKVEECDKKINALLSNKEDFKIIKEIKESGAITDSIQKREVLVLFNEYLAKQADTAKLNKISKLSSEIENKFSKFRAEVGRKKYSDNDVEGILKSSKSSKELEAVWTAQKEIGKVVAEDIKAIVKLRNEVAKEIGFKNYHEMSLKLTDQNPEDVSKLFDELDVLTKDTFIGVKKDMDDYLAKNCNIKPEELAPWHYQNRFFQEAPQIYSVDFDKYYEGKDIVKLTSEYFKGLGLPVDDMIAKSDLYEKPGKNQHAYCINVDRDALDIRALCNVKDNADWMGTMLHEYGHALYEKHYAKELPWVLKFPAHIFTTEAIAMLFGRLGTNPQWMQDMIALPAAEKAQIEEVAHKQLRLQQLVFSRWSQVMYRFEKSLYDNPDQDLNKLWWDLVEKYQMIKRPAGRTNPDWATKIHIATSPCYYHNYHLGELFASQLYYTLADKVLKVDPKNSVSFANRPEVGKYLIDHVFSVGAKYYWNDMIEKATGEKLTAKYYAKQFVN